MNEDEIIEEDIVLDAEDDTSVLNAEKLRRKREGGFDDISAFQACMCIIIATGLILLNLKFPDMAEEFFGMVKGLSMSDNEIFQNPIDLIMGCINELCQK